MVIAQSPERVPFENRVIPIDDHHVNHASSLSAWFPGPKTVMSVKFEEWTKRFKARKFETFGEKSFDQCAFDWSMMKIFLNVVVKAYCFDTIQSTIPAFNQAKQSLNSNLKR
jgi:hypothetical protein